MNDIHDHLWARAPATADTIVHIRINDANKALRPDFEIRSASRRVSLSLAS